MLIDYTVVWRYLTDIKNRETDLDDTMTKDENINIDEAQNKGNFPDPLIIL